MTCQEYLDTLLEGLSAEEAGPAAAAHEAGCATCRERGASMRAALAGIAALPAGTPPNFARGAMHKVSTARAPWEPVVPPLMDRIAAWLAPMMGQLATGAACLIVGAVLIGGFASSKKSAGPVQVAQVKASAGAVHVASAGARTTVEVPEVGYAQIAMGGVADATFRESTRAVLEGTSKVELTAGEVQLNVNHDKVGAAGFSVATPHGTVHVTGTEFAVRSDAEQTQVTLFRGSVRFEGRETVNLGAGERLIATALFVRRVTSAARPAWPTLPTTAEVEAQPEPVTRPPATVSAARVGASEAKAAVKSAAPIGGTALPEVTPNANVHEPFRP